MAYLKTIIREAIVRGFFRPYYWLRTSWPVWFYLLNREGRKRYRKESPPQDLLTQRIIRDLDRDGIAVAHLDELFPGENTIGQLQTYADTLLPNAQRDQDKVFLIKVFEAKRGYLLDYENPFTRLVLTPRVLGIVNGYMRMYAKFFYYSLNLTTPVLENVSRIKSQRWHRDNEDKKMCKMFIYLSDVDAGAGPFTYVVGSQHGGKWRQVLSPHPPRSYYPPQSAVEERIPRSDIKVCTAPAGTVIFCDTSGLHYGGYASEKNRLMFTAEYSSKASFISIQYRLAQNLQDRFASLSPAARFALTERPGWLAPLNLISQFSIRRNLF